MSEGSPLYEFLNLMGENEPEDGIQTLRHDAIVSMRYLKIAASSTYDTPKENDPKVLTTFEFSQECWKYAKCCEERLRGPLEEYLRRHGFALNDNGPEGIYLSRLESPSVLCPTKDDKYANVLVLMSNTIYKTKLQSDTNKVVIEWNPNTPIYFHKLGMMVPEGQLHYIHYLYPINPVDVTFQL